MPAVAPEGKPPEAETAFPEVPEEFPTGLFPPALANLIVAVSHRYSVEPAVVGAAVLVAMAAAFGPGYLIDTWRPTMAPAVLNFLLVGNGGSLWQGALETVLFPFVQVVQQCRETAQAANRAELEETYRRGAEAMAEQEKQGFAVSPGAKAAHAARGLLLRPELLLESLTLGRLQAALARSNNLALLLAPGRIDAADHWLRLKASERQALAAELRRSWDGQPSELPEFPRPLQLPLLWRMSPGNAPRLLQCPELFGDAGVPLFLLPLDPAGPAAPGLADSLEIEPLWEQVVRHWLKRRVEGGPEAYVFSAPAAGALVAYLNRIEARLADLPADQRCLVEFLPDAARRISLIFAALCGGEVDHRVQSADIEAAIGVAEWYGRASLRAAQRLQHPQATTVARPAARAGVKERMLQRIAARGPVRWRELRRSFANSRDALLAPVRDQLIAEGRIGWVEGDSGPELILAVRGSGGSAEFHCPTTAGAAGDLGAAGLHATTPATPVAVAP